MAKARDERVHLAIPILQRTAVFFTYFEKTWVPLAMSWSLAGRMVAAEKMGVPLDRVPTTTSHLEGWNAAFKVSYLPQYVLLLPYFSSKPALAFPLRTFPNSSVVFGSVPFPVQSPFLPDFAAFPSPTHLISGFCSYSLT